MIEEARKWAEELANSEIVWFSFYDINPTASADKDIGVDLALFQTKYNGKITYRQTTWETKFDDLANAIEVLNRIEAIDGKSERLSVAKSEIYTRQGNKKAAIAEIKALSEKYPNDFNYLALYGETLMMNGQLKKALKVYDKILREEPDNNRVSQSAPEFAIDQTARIKELLKVVKTDNTVVQDLVPSNGVRHGGLEGERG